MNILITGGAGFIGTNLAHALFSRGHVVTVMDNLSQQIHGTDSPLLPTLLGKVRFLRGDVRSREDWFTALKGQDAVVHFAAETGTGQSMYEIERYVDVNIRGTALLMDLLANESHSINRLVVASSRSIYGEGRYRCIDHGIIFPLARAVSNMEQGDFNVKCPHCSIDAELLATTEDSRIHPSSLYGITKQNQEQIILTLSRSLNIPAVALRYQNVYGPGQSLSNAYTGILSIFSTRIKNGNKIIVFEDGQESRDFVYIDDVVDATVAAVELDSTGQHVVNIGSGECTSVLTVARALIDAYGIIVPVHISGNFRIGDIRHNFAEISAAKKLLGFEPKVKFIEGISRFAEWVNSQAVYEDGYERSIEEMKVKGLYK